MKSYVLGFYINQNDRHVLMVRKNRGPDCVIGMLNGIGGKVETNEVCSLAMEREFAEETGKLIYAYQWKFCGILRSKEVENGFKVSFYIHYGPSFNVPLVNDVGEPLCWVDINDLPSSGFPQVVPNIKWLLPLCMDTDVDRWDIVDKS